MNAATTEPPIVLANVVSHIHLTPIAPLGSSPDCSTCQLETAKKNMTRAHKGLN
eukprot:CAMPEP_0202825460 /NCGR_PEP_ID=MMETSP1389-20130828/13052_1 /ASSEMBLY_ACC=CAM_ASM_000865 /TAXON_ID=302021 /ORGANISM="Rhodomonas sp., Strain CCMP768" /LENGTH=53 /DNA_ID=CAMNT_0049498695 /DNA_START=146 /DNA_END=304 /DNA_ORIENTATION=-